MKRRVGMYRQGLPDPKGYYPYSGITESPVDDLVVNEAKIGGGVKDSSD